MTLLLSVVGHMVTLLAAAIAIIGTTWDARAVGARKLTVTGRVAVVAAIVGFVVSNASSIRTYLDERERHRAAVAEISEVWKTLVYPFGLMLWSLDGLQPPSGIAIIDRLLQSNTLERFNTLDLRGDAPHHHGPWSSNLCEATQRGFTQLRQMQTIYVGIIDSGLITKLKDVATVYAISALQTLSPCGRFTPDSAHAWHLHSVTNLEEFRQYLRALRALRIALDEA